ANIEKKAPEDIAEDLSKKIELSDFLEEIRAIKSYINFRIKPKFVLTQIFDLKEDYGRNRLSLGLEDEPNLRIVIEYPAPNTNKALHFGHVRNMLLGKSVSNLLDYEGHKVFQVNMNNDRGIHICKSMLAYIKWGENKEPDKKGDHFISDFYVKFNEESKKDKNLEEEARELLRKWELGEPDTIALWKKMNNWVLEGFKETYKQLGITFDKEYFESDYYRKGKEIILKGVNEGIFEQLDDGAIVARLRERYGLEDKFLIRSDGTSIYITQDIYLAYLKKKDFQYDRSIYVVADEQIQHFKWLFAILDMLGFKEDNYHLA
ncbi:MAG: arginine--tRNA ligase, partial [Promethearchaeota archaeon]